MSLNTAEVVPYLVDLSNAILGPFPPSQEHDTSATPFGGEVGTTVLVNNFDDTLRKLLPACNTLLYITLVAQVTERKRTFLGMRSCLSSTDRQASIEEKHTVLRPTLQVPGVEID